MNKTILLCLGMVSAFVFGALTFWGYQKITEPAPVMEQAFLNDAFDGSFFNNSPSPITEMERMRKQMDRHFNNPGLFPDFNGWFEQQSGSFPVSQIKTGDDEESVFYVLNVSGKDVANIEAALSNGYLLITADLKEEGNGTSSSTHLEQSFPIPGNVDPDSLQTEHVGGEIIVKFRKLRA